MSMWELLVNGEVIDRISLETNKYEEAHTYFRLRKNLDSKSFNDLFIVKNIKTVLHQHHLRVSVGGRTKI